MKKIYMMSLFSALLGLIGCNTQSNKFDSVTVEDFANVITDTARVVLLDVRTPEEYAEGHIGDALNIDVTKDDFESKAEAVLPKEKYVALYCKSGNRSKKAANILARKGFKVIELSTGYMGWVSEMNQTITLE